MLQKSDKWILVLALGAVLGCLAMAYSYASITVDATPPEVIIRQLDQCKEQVSTIVGTHKCAVESTVVVKGFCDEVMPTETRLQPVQWPDGINYTNYVTEWYCDDKVQQWKERWVELKYDELFDPT